MPVSSHSHVQCCIVFEKHRSGAQRNKLIVFLVPGVCSTAPQIMSARRWQGARVGARPPVKFPIIFLANWGGGASFQLSFSFFVLEPFLLRIFAYGEPFSLCRGFLLLFFHVGSFFCLYEPYIQCFILGLPPPPLRKFLRVPMLLIKC